MKLVDRRCPICDSDQFSRIYLKSNFDELKLGQFAYSSRKLPEFMHHQMMRCVVCDVLYSSPAVSKTEYESSYQDAKFDSGVEASCAAETYYHALKDVLPSNTAFSVLDVGAGDGAFLEVLYNHGYKDIVGVEPSSAPVEAAKKQIKPLIRNELYSPQPFEGRGFDLVTCFQTLEHLYEPKQFLESVIKVLKPGGRLVVADHNFRSLSTLLMRSKSPIFDIEHLQLFSKKSLQALLEKVGLSDVRVRVLYNAYPLQYYLRLFPVPVEFKARLQKAIELVGVSNLRIAAPLGNLIAVGKKP